MKLTFKYTKMKRALLLLILLPVFTYGQFQERQNTYPVKANVITISYDGLESDVLKAIESVLIKDDYIISRLDNDHMVIETTYKKLKNASIRLSISLRNNHIEMRGFTINNLPLSGEQLTQGHEVLRAELRPTKITIMGIGFDEMKHLADKYKNQYNGSLAGMRE